VFNGPPYRDKRKLSGVFVHFRAPLQSEMPWFKQPSDGEFVVVMQQSVWLLKFLFFTGFGTKAKVSQADELEIHKIS
jgi:hypothetical protein